MSTISRSYFRALLDRHLNKIFSEIADREKHLESRSRKALQTYRELSGKGAAHETALEVACLELSDGFGFSLYQFLYRLTCEDFANIPDELNRPRISKQNPCFERENTGLLLQTASMSWRRHCRIFGFNELTGKS